LEESLTDLADQLTKSYELRRKIRSAMTYPILVLTAAAAIGMGLSLFVLPKVIKMFESITVDLPFSTRILLGFSRFMVSYGLLFFGGVVLGIVALVWFLKLRPIKPFSHAALLRIPIFGRIAHDFNLATFARTMATLLKAGIAIGEAFETTANTLRNVRFKKALMRVKGSTETGSPASSALGEYPWLFPTIATHMISVGERTGKLEETFDYLAEFYEDEVDSMTKNLSTILEPVLLIVIGITVAFLAIAIIAPIYNFVGSIERL
jgi:type IV pilus assembly protein PilC